MDTNENEIEARKKQAAFWLEYSQQLSTAIRYVEALAAAERAVALDESSAEAWYVKGTCQAMLAQNASALRAFEKALLLDNKFVPAWDGKAWVLGILGDKVGALEAIDRALELDPGYFEERGRPQGIAPTMDEAAWGGYLAKEDEIREGLIGG